MKFLPKTLFGRLFLLIFGFMMSMVVLVRLMFALVVAETAGQQLANYSHSMILFAQEINLLGTTDSKRRLADQLQQSTGILLRQNANEQFDPIPNKPIFNKWQDTVTQRLTNEITMSYQNDVQQIVWFHHQKPPQFSLGIPPIINVSTITQIFSITALVALVFSLFSAYVAAYYLNRPLRELAEKAKLIGQDIDSIAIEPSGPDEIRAVALAMNKMRADLDGITKKQKFLLSSMSHDLRTPLNRINMATQLLIPDSHGYIDSINADIEEMNEVIHRFIELARFNIEETELWQVGDIATVIREVAAKYQDSGSLISIDLKDTPPLRYKPKALQSYLYNVINNSIKHGDGNIAISTQVIDNKVALCVSDHGPGFPLSTEELLSYSDLDNDNKTVNGLGLRIVQLIAKLHEAELTLRNKAEGGAEVLLMLKVYVG